MLMDLSSKKELQISAAAACMRGRGKAGMCSWAASAASFPVAPSTVFPE